MPLFRCTDCGFVTTASQATALAAHEQGSSDCGGQVELIADFTRSPGAVGAAVRRRRRESSATGHDVPAAAHDVPAAAHDVLGAQPHRDPR
jgi:hypothetical protein